MEHVLITGGAGFIGRRLAANLLACGYKVRILDSLEPQVHGAGPRPPAGLDPEAVLQVGDVRDRDALDRALAGIDVVVHLAALSGVGQSMYEPARYASANDYGTAMLLEALARRPVRKLVVASSMSVYGEGLYRDASGRLHEPGGRASHALGKHEWEQLAGDGAALRPVATPEWKRPDPASVYGLGKYAQERMALMIGRAYGMPTVALRFFIVYGPNQALSNPYTGVLAIFAARLLNGSAPQLYEDGLQQRDFVSVHDAAGACRRAIERPDADGTALNIGSGQPTTLRDVAARLATAMGRPHIQPHITQTWRAGDARHCFADIGRARDLLGFEPAVTLDRGLAEYSDWLQDQPAPDRLGEAAAELRIRGLTL